MAKVILNDGSEKFVSPGEARALVAAGEAVFDQYVPTYSTRQITAEQPKAKAKRKTKAKAKAKPKAKVEPEPEADGD